MHRLVPRPLELLLALSLLVSAVAIPLPARADSNQYGTVSAGAASSVLVRKDGYVYQWGNNAGMQSRGGAGSGAEIASVAAGGGHVVALKKDGSVVAWGNDSAGQVTPPAAVSSGVVAVAAGAFHSLALKSDGTVVGWGDDSKGQVQVPPAAQAGVVSIAAGWFHNLALKSDGTVATWGVNDAGQAAVPNALPVVKAVAAGAAHSLALLIDGSVVGWGQNDAGQISIPAAASSEVVAISAGAGHSLALKADGSVLAWGLNSKGQATVPAAASADIVAVAAGGTHSLALKSDGTLIAWGGNQYGQAGKVSTITGFSLPPVFGSKRIPVSTLTVSDPASVAGYLITESGSAPGAADAGWTASAPALFDCSGDGLRTLYAWTKDSAGTVSASRSAEVLVDLTAPTLTSFTLPAHSAVLRVPITSLSAGDANGVAGYLVTESANPPASSAGGWTPTAPQWYQCATPGSKTLFAWAKDAAGNVSTSLSAEVSVDLDPPTVNAFVLPAVTSSLSVGITTFNATDNVGVTGYLVTEGADPPASDHPGWSSTAPDSFSFASQGTKTLHAWAKDAAQNVSLALSASVIVDQNPPQVTVAPVVSPTIATEIRLSGTVSDDVAVSSVSVQLGSDPPVVATVTGNSWSCQLPGIAPGDNAITVTAKDSAGNSKVQGTSVKRLYAGPATTDGTITVADALLVLNFVLGLAIPTPEQFLRSDVAPVNATTHLVEPDSKLDLDDVIVILRRAVGIPW